MEGAHSSVTYVCYFGVCSFLVGGAGPQTGSHIYSLKVWRRLFESYLGCTSFKMLIRFHDGFVKEVS